VSGDAENYRDLGVGDEMRVEVPEVGHLSFLDPQRQKSQAARGRRAPARRFWRISVVTAEEKNLVIIRSLFIRRIGAPIRLIGGGQVVRGHGEE
jgi:hypothetical protein